MERVAADVESLDFGIGHLDALLIGPLNESTSDGDKMCIRDRGGRGDPVFPQAPDDRYAIDAGKHAIDRHHRIVGGSPAAERFVAVDREIDLIAAGREGLRELFGGLRIVLDDENAAPRLCRCLLYTSRCV